MRHCVVPWFVRHCCLSSSLAKTLVSFLHAGIPTIVNSAISLLLLRPSFCGVRLHLSAFTPAAAPSYSLTWLCASWSAGTPQGLTGLHAWWSLSALSRASRTSGITFSAAAHDCSSRVTAPSSLEMVWRYTCGLTFGFFSALELVLPAFEVWTECALWPVSCGLPAQVSDYLSYDQRTSLSR